jgi:hypothetical protein
MIDWMRSAGLTRGVLCCLLLIVFGCASGNDPGVKGNYATWDDVIDRWIGKQVSDLYLELGPPNLHPHEIEEGMTEMVWDFGVDRMPGQADEYGLLPMYGAENCRLAFFADSKGIVRSGKRIGCE